ncbi:MAG: efflux transporter outer membrane subunit [Burkholderiales bacterium]
MKTRSLSALLAALSFGMGGCALLPPEGKAPAMLAAPSLQGRAETARRTPASAPAEWPQARWWQDFGDAQLDSLIARALRDQPSLTVTQARLARARSAQQLADQESGIRYASDASAQRQHISANGLFPPPLGGSTLDQGDISLNAAYTLDWWGKNRALLAAATGEVRAAQAERAAAERLIAAQIAAAYFAWEGAAERLKLAAALVEKRRERLQLANSRLRNGLDSALPVRELAAQLAQDQDAARRLDYQARYQRYRLAALAGQGPDWAETLATPAPPPAHLTLPRAIPLDWLGRRPDLSALKWRAEAAARQIDMARAEFYPNIDLRLTAGLESVELGQWLSGQSRFGSFGPAVHIPLFNTSSLRARLSAREAEYAEAVGQYNSMVLEAARQVADSLAHLASLEQRRALQAEATQAVDAARRLQARRYARGLTDPAALLDADIAALRQHDKETQLRSARTQAMVALFQALGGGYEPSQE